MQMKPYFLENPEWYEIVEDSYDPETDEDRGYILTDKAPQEAIDSYNEFYSCHDFTDDEGNSLVPDGWVCN